MNYELVDCFERHEAGNGVGAEKLQHPELAENLYYPHCVSPMMRGMDHNPPTQPCQSA